MTAVCGGGTSSPKAGYDSPIQFTTQAIGAFFNAIPSPLWLDFVSYLGPQSIDPSEFCTVDPPADPGITAIDLANVVNFGNPLLNAEALFKLAQLFRRYLWFQICECDSGPQPTPPSPPTLPTGAPVINPPGVGPGYPTGQPCAQWQQSFDTGAADNIHQQDVALPPGATVLAVDSVFDPPGGTSGPFASAFFKNASGTFLSGSALTGWTGGTDITHAQVNIPATAAFLNMEWGHSGTWTGPDPCHVEATFSAYCGTTPSGGGGQVLVPCPADPFTNALLNQILELVRLIQRQAVPFSHIASTVHSGLTGQGELAVQGLLGVRIVVDDDGFGFGSEDGTPDVLFGEGWINWGNPDGFKRREYISASPMVSLPPLAGQYTRVGYSLPPGASITITELVREA